jgi:hypothetical protein
MKIKRKQEKVKGESQERKSRENQETVKRKARERKSRESQGKVKRKSRESQEKRKSRKGQEKVKRRSEKIKRTKRQAPGEYNHEKLTLKVCIVDRFRLRPCGTERRRMCWERDTEREMCAGRLCECARVCICMRDERTPSV